MIKVKNWVPEVYYKESRDFQLLGRIFEVLFNYTYNNAQILSKNINSIENNSFLLELLCTSLGFDIKQQYNDEQLNAISSIFLELLKNKGNIKSVKLLVNLLLNIMGINEEVTIENSDGILDIFIPSDILDLNLFNDVLNYILPAGTRYNIRKSIVIERQVNNTYYYSQEVTGQIIPDKELVIGKTDPEYTGVIHPQAADKEAYFKSDDSE